MIYLAVGYDNDSLDATPTVVDSGNVLKEVDDAAKAATGHHVVYVYGGTPASLAPVRNYRHGDAKARASAKPKRKRAAKKKEAPPADNPEQPELPDS